MLKKVGPAPPEVTEPTETTEAPVEEFTIAIVGLDDRRGTLSIEWGPFRWTAPIVVAPLR